MVRLLLATVLFLGLSCSAFGQLVCDFKADTTTGCSPIQISFSDLSTGPNPITYHKWEFGNGGTSFLANPSRIYANPGLFTVTLTVSDGTDTATKTISQYIEVYKNPKADFTFSKLTLCKPVQVAFQNQSTQGGATIVDWTWDFGDLTSPSKQANPTHDYLNRGTYSVILSVIDANGCRSDVQKKNIVVVDPPEAAFTATNRSDCKPPLNTVFTNQSAGGQAPFTYSWDFGDGSTSTATSPSHTYANSGVYDVTLIISDANGCHDTLKESRYVTIGQTLADFIYPDSLCRNASYQFVNQSIGAHTFFLEVWNTGKCYTA